MSPPIVLPANKDTERQSILHSIPFHNPPIGCSQVDVWISAAQLSIVYPILTLFLSYYLQTILYPIILFPIMLTV